MLAEYPPMLEEINLAVKQGRFARAGVEITRLVRSAVAVARSAHQIFLDDVLSGLDTEPRFGRQAGETILDRDRYFREAA
jgi:hypothetical protein